MGPETLIMVFVGVFLTAYLTLRFLVHWWERITPSPDPWDKETAEAIEETDAQPVCHHCLTPLSARDYQCPNCGASEGAYSNWLPFPQIFALGEVLRNGVEPGRRLGLVSIIGYVLVALVEYTFLAPVYLGLFVYRLVTARSANVSPAPPEEPDTSKGPPAPI